MRRRIFRIVGIVLAVVVVIAAGVGGFAYLFIHKFNPEPPDVQYPKAKSALEAQRQDIDYFGRLIAMDRAFSPSARAAAGRQLQALSSSATVLDRGHFRVALFGIAALADNGHTSLGSKKPIRAKILPIRLSAFSDGLYFMRVEKTDADLLGA